MIRPTHTGAFFVTHTRLSPLPFFVRLSSNVTCCAFVLLCFSVSVGVVVLASSMMAAEGVKFDELDGTDVRVGIITTRYAHARVCDTVLYSTQSHRLARSVRLFTCCYFVCVFCF